MPGAAPVGRFPPAQRLRRRSEIQAVQAHGRRIRTPHFILLIHTRQEPSLPHARLGVVASRKIGNAIHRNRAKRLVREAFRATRDLWSPKIDLVVVSRKGSPELLLDDVVREWRAVEELIRGTR